MTLFLWVCKVRSVPFGYVCVHRCRAQYVAWFRIYMQSSTVNRAIKDVDFYRCMNGISECHV